MYATTIKAGRSHFGKRSPENERERTLPKGQFAWPLHLAVYTENLILRAFSARRDATVPQFRSLLNARCESSRRQQRIPSLILQIHTVCP